MAKYVWPPRKIVIEKTVIQINEIDYIDGVPIVRIDAWQVTEDKSRIPLVKDLALQVGDTIHLEIKS